MSWINQMKRFKILIFCIVVGVITGVVSVYLARLLHLNLNSTQEKISFCGFSLFGVTAGIINALTIKTDDP